MGHHAKWKVPADEETDSEKKKKRKKKGKIFQAHSPELFCFSESLIAQTLAQSARFDILKIFCGACKVQTAVDERSTYVRGKTNRAASFSRGRSSLHSITHECYYMSL